MFPEGRTPDYDSEAIAKEDWEPLVAETRDADGAVTLSTGPDPHIALDPLRVSFSNASGTRFTEEGEGGGCSVDFVKQPGEDVFAAPLGNRAAVRAARGGRMKKPDRTPKR